MINSTSTLAEKRLNRKRTHLHLLMNAQRSPNGSVLGEGERVRMGIKQADRLRKGRWSGMKQDNYRVGWVLFCVRSRERKSVWSFVTFCVILLKKGESSYFAWILFIEPSKAYLFCMHGMLLSPSSFLNSACLCFVG